MGWNRTKILGFLEAMQNKVNETFDELEKNGINEVDNFKLESEECPLNVSFTVTKEDKFMRKRFSQAERECILDKEKRNGESK